MIDNLKKLIKMKDYKIVHSWKSLISIGIIFAIFVGVLLYSYIFKFGYLKIATNLFFILTPILILINILKKNKDNRYRLFWGVLFLFFVYALLDKYLRLHLILSKYVVGINFDPAIFVNIIYIVFYI